MRRRIISENNIAAWQHCSRNQLIRMLGSVCPAIKQAIRGNVQLAEGRLSAYDAYVNLAEKYGMGVGSHSVYAGDYYDVTGFSYWYTDENGGRIEDSDVFPKLSKAQLESVHTTMYRLEDKMQQSSK